MPLRQIWAAGMTAMMHREDQWEGKSHLAVRALAALKELLLLLPTWDGIKGDMNSFWGEVHAASEGLFNTFLAGLEFLPYFHGSWGSLVPCRIVCPLRLPSSTAFFVHCI